MSYNAYETLLQKTGKVCPDGRLEYTFEGTSKECIEPTSQADCPSGFEFVEIPKDMTRTNRGTGIAGVYPFDRRCRKTGSEFAPDVATPTETAPPTAKNYFWLYAIAVGVGIYLLTRSKTKI